MTDTPVPDWTWRLRDILGDLVNVDANEASSGPLADLAARLDTLREIVVVAKAIIEMIETAMPLDMEADMVPAGRYIVVREKEVRSSWKPSGAERMRADIRSTIATRMSIDVATGEVNQERRNVIVAAIDELFTGVPSFSSIKVDASRRWGLHMGEYRTYTDGYKINLLPAPEAQP